MKKILLLLVLGLILGRPAIAGSVYPFKVNVSGKGKESLLFIPGFACPAAVWEQTLTLFDPYYTCYTLTMPGFGGVPAAKDPSFRQWEQDIARFIAEQHLKPIVIGHSMGGGLALALAADYPQSVSKVVVVDALPCLAQVQDPRFHPWTDSMRNKVIDQITAIPQDQFGRMQKASARSLVSDTAKAEVIASWSRIADRRTFATMFCDFLNTDLRPGLSGISCPVLILLEAPFRNISAAVEAQYSPLRQAQLAYATKGLHFIMYDDFDWYQQQLKSFIPVP